MEILGIKIPEIIRRKAKDPPPTGMVAFMMQNPVWTETNLKNLAVAGYENCMIVFSCVGKIAKAAGGIPWVLFRKARSEDAKREQIFKQALLDLVWRPNESQGQSRFIEGLTGFYYIAGNSYVLSVGSENPEIAPKELYWLYPHQVEVLPGTRYEPVAGYRYRADSSKSKDYDKKEVLHLKSFHPTNYWYGLSPLKVAARGIDTLNTAEEWNMKLIQNEMRPSGAIKVEGRMTEKGRKTFRKELVENLGGSKHAGMPIILEGAQEWMPFSLSPKDADWLNSQTLTMRNVCLALGIPPELMGDAENKTYSNVKEARKALYEETILPYMDFLRDELNNWLTPKFGDNLELDYDRDSIEALREDREAVFSRAQASHFLTVNEKRLMTGFESVGGGDVIYMPINMVAMGGESGSAEGMKRKANKSFWTAAERKRALWDNCVLIVKAKEKTFDVLAKRYLEAQVERVKKNLKEIEKIENMDGFVANRIFKKDEEAEEYRKVMMPWYVEAFVRAYEAGVAATKGELYILEEKQAEMPAEFQEALNRMVLETGIEVTDTILDDIYRVWAVASLEGWDWEKFKAAVPEKMAELSEGKRRVWKQTQTAKIENWGNVEGYKKAEFVTKKGWLSSFAPTSRDSHMATSEQEVLLDEPFMIGGSVPAMYPGGSGLPEHDINCLCFTYPVVNRL